MKTLQNRPRRDRFMLATFAINIAVIAAIVGWFWFDIMKECRVEPIGHSLSPDGRREGDVVLSDCPGQFLLDFSHLALRLRPVAGSWQDVVAVDGQDLEALELPLVWTDDRHLVMTFGPDARTPPQRKTVMGVEVEIRRRAALPPVP